MKRTSIKTPLIASLLTLTLGGRYGLRPKQNGDPKVAVFYCVKTYAALNILCGSITNFFGTPASNSP